MNERIICDMAWRTLFKKKVRRTFHVFALGIRSDGAIVVSQNGSDAIKNPSIHAEARLANKLDCGATVYVVRCKADGTFGLAKPCPTCEAILRNMRVKCVYYTMNADGDFEKESYDG